jgi:hypothetical protein
MKKNSIPKPIMEYRKLKPERKAINIFRIGQIKFRLFQVIQTISEYLRLFNTISYNFRIFHTISDYFRIFKVISNKLRLFHTISDKLRLFQVSYLFKLYSEHTRPISYTSGTSLNL